MRGLALAITLLLAAGAPRGAKPKRIVVDAAVAKDPASLQALESHIYRDSPMGLVKIVRAMLEEKGFPVEDSSDPLTLQTGWRSDKKGGGRARYTVRVTAISAAAVIVAFTKLHEDGLSGEAVSGVDLDAAWALLTKLEPDTAAKLKEAAPALPDATPAKAASASAKPTPFDSKAHAPAPIHVPTAAPATTAAPTKRVPATAPASATKPASGTKPVPATKPAR